MAFLVVFSTLLCLASLIRTSESNGEPPRLCIQWYEFACIGGDRALLTTGIWLNYTSNSTDEAGTNQQSYSCSLYVDYNSPLPELQYYEGDGSRNITSVNYMFEQPEHGGGSCHCFNITECIDSVLLKSRCGGNPQIIRRVHVNWSYSSLLRVLESSDPLKDLPISTNCTAVNSTIEISYTVYASQNMCGAGGSVENRDELEFSIRLLSNPSQWIPLSYTRINRPPEIMRIRGYYVVDTNTLDSNAGIAIINNIQICGFSETDSIQLRWLMSSYYNDANRPQSEDRWSLDNVELNFSINEDKRIFIMDTFDLHSLNNRYWKPTNIRNGNVSTVCSIGSNNPALVFGIGINDLPYDAYTASHSALTNIISLTEATPPQSNYPPVDSAPICSVSDTINEPLTATSNRNMDTTTSEIFHTTTASIDDNNGTTNSNLANQGLETTIAFIDDNNNNNLMNLETQVLNTFQQTISTVLNSTSVAEQLSQLTNISMNMPEDPLVVVYILGVIFNNITSINCQNETLQASINIGSNIIQQSQSLNESMNAFVLGSTLLVTLERLVIPCEEEFSYTTMDTAGVQIRQVNTTDAVVTFNTSTFGGWTPPYVQARLPLQDLELFSLDNNIRIIANIYRNISNILPAGINNSDPVVSDVFGISVQCGEEICPTSNISFNSSVLIVFNHDIELEDLLKSNSSRTTTCVFLDIISSSSIFQLGNWSDRGCNKNENMSSNQRTVCECDHLTHFAILLSARPVRITNDNVQLSLNIISYIGVTVSLVAMAVLIFVFIFFRTLHSLRNYIHIHLCVNLAIAQIIFVVGIDKTSNSAIPIYCRVIAVLLHYFFLVSFMWMLMEGVFLYVTLVRVFVKKQKPYYIAFTVISYGLPLLYMGGLSLPLGFAYFSPSGYGYSAACYLEPERGFIWAIIAPVILIFLVNVCFFIMAVVIMWRHQKRITDKSKLSNVKDWLKAAISLTVIMGITWIFGLLIIELQSLLAFVYVYTILVAFQGLFIFVLFVLFSKSVRDTIRKYWKVRVNQSDILTKYFGESLSTSKQMPKTSEPHYSAPPNKSTDTTSTPYSTATQKQVQNHDIHMNSLDDTLSSKNNLSTFHDTIIYENVHTKVEEANGTVSEEFEVENVYQNVEIARLRKH